MTQLWPEGYYNTDGLVAAECVDIKGRDVWKLTFQMTGCPDQKEVFCHMTGGAKEITYKTLAQLGWNGNTKAPAFSNPQAIEQLKLEHYYATPQSAPRESWKTAAGSTPVPDDRAKRIEAEYRAYTKSSPAPAGRPTAPPAAKAQTPAATTPAITKPASEPPSDDEDGSGEPPVTVANDKAQAWAVWDKAAAQGGKQPDQAKWKAVIAEVGAEVGKKSAEFGPAEWTKVAQAGEIPF